MRNMVYSYTFNPHLRDNSSFNPSSNAKYRLISVSAPQRAATKRVQSYFLIRYRQVHLLVIKLQLDISTSSTHQEPHCEDPSWPIPWCYFSFARIPVHPCTDIKNRDETRLVGYYEHATLQHSSAIHARPSGSALHVDVESRRI